MTDDEKIQSIIDTIDGWDMKTVVQFAAEMWAENLNDLDPSELEKEYQRHVIGD